jgi:hypothetical protein
MGLVFVGGIDEDEPRDAIGVIRCEDANVEPSDGCSNEHQRSAEAAAVDEFGQLGRDAMGCPGRRARIAVSHSCPVVRADARESSDVRLYVAPASTGATQACVKDDRRRTGARAPQMQPVATDVDEMAWRWRRRQVFSSGKTLVRTPRDRSKHDDSTQSEENA